MNTVIANYRKGVGVWVQNVEHVWISAVLENDFYDNGNCMEKISVVLENGQNLVIPIKNVGKDLPPLRNPDFLIDTGDLTSLSYLHEPDVLHSLKTRFQMSHIYTYCGIVLVAINPYSKCEIYGKSIFDIYRNQNVRQLDPHIYAVAEEAFASLTRHNKSQSIIISGESGAGKTVSAKHVMQYLAEACSKSGPLATPSRKENQHRIESRVLASNPIMEAIGNAKTIRNDNSSRFGKFIHILFDERSTMCGATMQTYLLEKSRVVGLNTQERNYHIFYQMCASRNSVAVLEDLQLNDPSEFLYLANGGCTSVETIYDEKSFFATQNAMTELGFSSSDIASIFRILAGLLHFGNVQFDPNSEAATFYQLHSAEHMRLCCNLWQINQQEMIMWLKHRRFKARDMVADTPFTFSQANVARDATAKLVYSRLFDKIVAKINESLGGEQKAKQMKRKFVGVLDIYGFEIFDSNSFEQLCINYANEMLQQQFTQHVFKLEQHEYEKEGIQWSRIDFNDNQPCLDLIESRLGILDLLDQECKKAPSTDNNWYINMTTVPQVKTSQYFSVPRVPRSRVHVQQFLIRHFASEVIYDVDGFVEKNLDSVNMEQVETLRNSKLPLLTEILSDFGTSEPNAQFKVKNGPHQTTKKTTAAQFRESLKGLKSVLDSTMPHYVRCVKPNDDKEPWKFHIARSVEQLRACGVLETIRISAEGYPSRWTYDEFRDRYRILAMKAGRLPSSSVTAQAITGEICNFHLGRDKFALGKTKVFFRTGQVAHLESIRSEKVRSSAVMIQKIFRGYMARKRYEKIRNSVRTVQAAGRAWMAWRWLKFIQIHRASIVIQSHLRGYIQRKKYSTIYRLCLAIQARWRGRMVRKKLYQVQTEHNIIIVQKYIRGYLARRKLNEMKQATVTIQCWVRRYLAKKELRKLKIEAKSVNHLENLNKGLENKIISMQHRLNQSIEERDALKQTLVSMVELKEKAAKSKELEIELSNAKRAIARYCETNSQLEGQLEKLKQELENVKRLLMEEKQKNGELAKQLAQNASKPAMNGHHAEEGIGNGYVSTFSKRVSMGMIQVLDIDRFVRALISDMKPDIAAKLEPKAIAAFLLFMAIRYEMHIEQEYRIYEIFEAALSAIKDMLRERFDFDTCVLWLANIWRLYQLFKQYSGKKDYVKFSTAAQMEHVIRNQNLDDLEKQLEPLMSHLYIITLTEILEPMISTKIVPAVLEHKEIEKLQAAKTRTLRMKVAQRPVIDSMQDLLDQLTFIHDKFTQLGLDFPVISQLFSELTSVITTNAFNRLMFRRDFCTHAAAIQVKHNVTLIQNWLRDHNLPADGLRPLMEACHLLQARKTEQDIEGFHEMCSRLNVGQICRLLTHYKSEGVEAQLQPGFIEKVEKELRLKRNLQPTDSQPPMLSSSRSPALELIFVPSAVSLDAIQVPQSLKNICRKL